MCEKCKKGRFVPRITAAAVEPTAHSLADFISGTGSSTNAGVDSIESRHACRTHLSR